MIRKAGFAIVGLIALAVMLFGVTRLIALGNAPGTLPPLSESGKILMAEGCQQPCWHGIQPGKTTLAEAYTLLNADSTLTVKMKDYVDFDSPVISGSVSSASGAADSPVDQIWLLFKARLLLNDAIRAFGQPTGLVTCGRVDTTDGHVYFANNQDVLISSIYVVMMDRHSPLDPTSNVAAVSYRLTIPKAHQRNLQPWPGFVVPALVGDCKE
jgi:hypothetical protein